MGSHLLPLALGPTQMSATAMLLGLVALLGILFGLQRLRVRHRSRLVVTTLFWREALEESRARTLVERFRHPLTYLLLSLIGGLLWLSVARLESNRDEGVQHTFLLDGSASMAVEGRFERAVEALTVALEETPRERSEVIFCGVTTRTVLARGEDRALLESRLEGLAPEATPSSLETALASMAALEPTGTDAPRRFVIAGSQLPGESADALLGEGDWMEHLPIRDEAETALENVGITALGIAPAQSGAFDAVDVRVEIRGASAESVPMAITLGGQPVSGAQKSVLSADAVEYVFRDVRPESSAGTTNPADESGQLVVTLAPETGDALALDNRAEILVPELRLVRVVLVPTGRSDVDSSLRSMCLADPAIEVVESAARADVAIGGAPPRGTASGNATGVAPLPRLAIGQASDQEHSIEVADPASSNPEELLKAAVGELALDRIDAARLASELGRPLSLGVDVDAASALASGATAPRSISLWAELFDPTRSSFTESRAFPVVIGRAVRWLAGTPELVPYRATGRPQPVRLSDAVAGQRYPWEQDLAATSLLDPSTTIGVGAATAADSSRATAPGAVAREAGGAGPWRFATWILALVLALLVVEWVLFQRGRIA